MRIVAAVVVLAGCDSGAPAPPIGAPSAPVPRAAVAIDAVESMDAAPSVPLPAVTGGPLCGFATFDEFDRETWHASSSYTYELEPNPSGGRTPMSPPGKPMRLGPPPPVGTCRVHAILPEDGKYEIRSGKRLVAEIAALDGPVLRVPGFRIAGIGVGSTGAEMFAAFPAATFTATCEMLTLWRLEESRLELACSFSPIGNTDEDATRLFLRGKLPENADGDTATATARGSVVTGMQPFVRRSGPP